MLVKLFACIKFCYRRHTVIVYSPSDQPVNLEPSDQEDLLQYLYPRAQMDENANPRTFAVYENTSNVPVSLTVDDLQPSTTYLIFVHVQMLYQVSTLSYIHVCASRVLSIFVFLRCILWRAYFTAWIKVFEASSFVHAFLWHKYAHTWKHPITRLELIRGMIQIHKAQIDHAF